MSIKEKDIVIITGHTLQKGEQIVKHLVLAEVVAVGKYDAFVTLTDSSSYSKNPFRVPLSRCQKVASATVDIEARVKEPSLGDLVLSIDTTYTGTKKNVGVVRKIISVPGSEVKAEIEHSTKKIIVPYKSLIILEN